MLSVSASGSQLRTCVIGKFAPLVKKKDFLKNHLSVHTAPIVYHNRSQRSHQLVVTKPTSDFYLNWATNSFLINHCHFITSN